jgi:hypothetical protein
MAVRKTADQLKRNESNRRRKRLAPHRDPPRPKVPDILIIATFEAQCPLLSATCESNQPFSHYNHSFKNDLVQDGCVSETSLNKRMV